MEIYEVAVDTCDALITSGSLGSDVTLEIEGTLDNRVLRFTRARIHLSRDANLERTRDAGVARPGGSNWNIISSLPADSFDALLLLAVTGRLRRVTLSTTMVRYGKAAILTASFTTATADA